MWNGFFCYGIGNCSYSSGISTRIALAILGVQSAGFALFYGIGNCSCSSGTSTRIALAILGVQSAGFALFYYSDKKLLLCEIRKVAAFLCV